MSELAAQIAALSTQIGRFADDQEAFLSQNNALLNNVVAATNTMNAALQPDKLQNIIYVNGFTGDDASNNPRSASDPVRTLGRGLQLCVSLGLNHIRLQSDVYLDTRVTLNNLHGSILITSYDGSAPSSTRREIEIRDRVDGASLPGQLLYDRVNTILILFDVNVHLNSQFSGSSLLLTNTSLNYQARSVRVTQSSRNLTSLIGRSFADCSNLYLVASLFEPVNVEGRIIEGVGGDEAVDDQFWVTSNNLVLPADAP